MILVAVKVENVTKNYGKVIALNGCSLQVEEGGLFGLLGVNGAGKTTLIKILCGLSSVTDGEAYVFGKSVASEMAQIKPLIGISPQETSVAGKLTVKENLE
ncbi:MAG: ATP-binding cassette domain-containing protein, partial [Clostridia bacterium]|nr:ATP-binding cassette domain-containing protein [Clostridia bacterium]